jgi:replicative DNA helicase
LENIKLRALLNIQKFEEWDGNDGPSFGGGNWKQIPPTTPANNEGAKLFIQKGSRMNSGEYDEGFDENPF